MASYISLVNWTDQGIRNVKDSPKRLDAARDAARSVGVELRDFYMTIGSCDMVIIAEAPDDDAMARFSLKVGMGGNIRTTTLKAFGEAAYRKLIASL